MLHGLKLCLAHLTVPAEMTAEMRRCFEDWFWMVFGSNLGNKKKWENDRKHISQKEGKVSDHRITTYCKQRNQTSIYFYSTKKHKSRGTVLQRGCKITNLHDIWTFPSSVLHLDGFTPGHSGAVHSPMCPIA